MPCNSDRNISVSDEFQCILSEISTICKMSNCHSLIIGGDLNLDFNRNGSVKGRLETFMMSENFTFVTSYRSLIDYSFESKADNDRSHIDHFPTSNCLLELIKSYGIHHDGDNLSDHNPLFLSLKINNIPQHNNQITDTLVTKPDWKSCTPDMLNSYSNKVSNLLQQVSITGGILYCNTLCCKSHDKHIEEFCNNIIYICLNADETNIPPKKRHHKCIPSWSSEVRSAKEKAIMWHKIWKDNGSPHEVTVAEIRHSTSSRYHYVLSKVKRNKQGIRNSKLASAMFANNDKQFWKAVKSINGNTKQCVLLKTALIHRQLPLCLLRNMICYIDVYLNYCHVEIEKL